MKFKKPNKKGDIAQNTIAPAAITPIITIIAATYPIIPKPYRQALRLPIVLLPLLPPHLFQLLL